ncbi:UDP-N-acetylglucosamine 2-epimerase [Fusobacterium varium]|uniref:UDP-N-acetylglucosamine 2-epimerase n=1 Tax=Fusobacterium varium TaxID=856 RepID=UPI002FF0EF11
MRKKICIITGTRAEYGLLKSIIKKIKLEKDLILQIIVTGMHLSPEFGLTYKEIEKDGFLINEKIEILLSSDTEIGVSKSIGLAMISFSEAYSRLKPDLIILLGDRYEILAATIAAYISRIPVAHISGGDITEGAYDDAFRHSITKMAYLHFPGSKNSRRRIMQLGESPERIFDFGDPGIENIKNTEIYNRKELSEILKFDLEREYILVVMHSTTLENFSSAQQMKNLFCALKNFEDYNIVFIKGNSDNNGRKINQMIDEYEKENKNRVKSFISISIKEYLSLLKNSEVLLGNSSSGIVEAPALEKINLNIGDRQKGRERANTTIHCDGTKEEILKNLSDILNGKYNNRLKKVESPYGDGNTSSNIVKIIKKFLFEEKIDLKKKFYDIEVREL